jgi:ABC-type lipoprotein release transport system permease subunit
VLAFICFIIASILAGIGGVILNNVLYGIFELQVVQYTIKNILLICVISFGISLAATVLPVMAEAKKSPVESIRQL